MSRPVVIAFFALMAGVAAGDILLYDATWMAIDMTKALWVLLAPWGFCLVVTLLALLRYRQVLRHPLTHRYPVFSVLTFLFFLSVGFARYAAVAERQHREWAVQGRPVSRGNPDEFDVARWQWVSGTTGRKKGDDAGPMSKGLAWREKILSRVKTLGIEEQTLAIVSAMTMGDRSLLKQDTRDLYAQAGASHLLALSGLHLGIIVGLLLTWMNSRLLLSRWRKVVGVMILLFIGGYTFLAGMPASLVRAALMTSIFVVASLLQRYGSPRQHLLLTGIVMLLWQPMYLFDVGAQLSFLAVAGILLFYHPLYVWIFNRWRYLVFRLERYWLLWPFKLVAVSLCAQVLTLPLVAHYFHQIPLYGPLLSIVLIPLTTLLLYLALLLILLSWLWPMAAGWLGTGLSWIVWAQLWLMAQAAHWPGAIIHDFWSRKAEPQVVVYHNRRCPALHVIASPEQSWLLMPEPDSLEAGMKYIRRDFWRRRLTAEPQVLRGRKAVVLKEGLKAVMVDSGNGDTAANRTTAEVDVLWVVRGFRGGRLGTLSEAYRPRLLVLDASLPQWQRLSLAAEATQLGWAVYDVAEKGALRFLMYN